MGSILAGRESGLADLGFDPGIDLGQSRGGFWPVWWPISASVGVDLVIDFGQWFGNQPARRTSFSNEHYEGWPVLAMASQGRGWP